VRVRDFIRGSKQQQAAANKISKTKAKKPSQNIFQDFHTA
jgi:hypothetical protein